MIVKVTKRNTYQVATAAPLKTISAVKVVKLQKFAAPPAAEVKPSLFNRVTNARPLSAKAARDTWSQLFAGKVEAEAVPTWNQLFAQEVTA